MAQTNKAFLDDYTKHVKSSSKRQSRKFRDIDLDFGRHPVTNDINVVEDAIAIKRSVRNLIQTNFYERPMHPELGCGIREMLFENYSPVISIYIKRKIEEVLINNEPRIRLTGITVNGDDFEKGARAEEANEFLSGATEIDNNRVVIDIFFDIIGVPQPQQVSINLYRVR